MSLILKKGFANLLIRGLEIITHLTLCSRWEQSPRNNMLGFSFYDFNLTKLWWLFWFADGSACQSVYTRKSSTTTEYEVHSGCPHDSLVVNRGLGCWFFLWKSCSCQPYVRTIERMRCKGIFVRVTLQPFPDVCKCNRWDYFLICRMKSLFFFFKNTYKTLFFARCSSNIRWK